jgi:hypothetical protein
MEAYKMINKHHICIILALVILKAAYSNISLGVTGTYAGVFGFGVNSEVSLYNNLSIRPLYLFVNGTSIYPDRWNKTSHFPSLFLQYMLCFGKRSAYVPAIGIVGEFVLFSIKKTNSDGSYFRINPSIGNEYQIYFNDRRFKIGISLFAMMSKVKAIYTNGQSESLNHWRFGLVPGLSFNYSFLKNKEEK